MNMRPVVRSAALALTLCSATSIAGAQTPMEILRGLDAAPRPGPAGARPGGSQPPGSTPGAAADRFVAQGYRQPVLMEAFAKGDFSRTAGVGELNQIKFYIMHLVGAANQTCPNVDQRIVSTIMQASLPAMGNRDAMAQAGWQAMFGLLQQAARPEQMIQGIIADGVWEGDARADMTTFLQRYGCGEDVNAMLQNAAAYFRDPSGGSRNARPRELTTQTSTSVTPQALADQHVAQHITSKFEPITRTLSEDARAETLARYRNYEDKVRRTIIDYESVQITPEKVIPILKADRVPEEFVSFFEKKALQLRASGVQDESEIAIRAANAMYYMRDGSRPGGGVPGYTISKFFRDRIYNSEFGGLTGEQTDQLATALRGNARDFRNASLVTYLTIAAVPPGIGRNPYSNYRPDYVNIQPGRD